FGQQFNFWRGDIKLKWSGNPWDEFLRWVTRFDLPEERRYKLAIAERFGAARSAVRTASADWLALLKRAFGGENNLVLHWVFLPFLTRCAEREPESRVALEELWKTDSDVQVRLDQFCASAAVPIDKISKGGAAGLGSVLLMGLDAPKYPPYMASPYRLSMR